VEKHTPDYFKSLAKQLRFELTDEEAIGIAEEFTVLINQMNLLNAIDTNGVSPMVYPIEEPTTFMREDVADQILSAQEALNNAPSSKNGFFVTKKVVL
jgi:aspartyl-tRNA(Asn)/glutamyl-tRNA(Gln) amidotransferase subunit C